MNNRKALQTEILRRLEASGSFLKEQNFSDLGDRQEIGREVIYLVECGLATAAVRRFDGEIHFGRLLITAKGSDYIAAENTIGAEMNVITVRLHQDTIRDLLIARVRESDADDTVKGKLVDQLKALPAQGVAKLAERALEQALQTLPNAIQWLQTAL